MDSSSVISLLLSSYLPIDNAFFVGKDRDDYYRFVEHQKGWQLDFLGSVPAYLGRAPQARIYV